MKLKLKGHTKFQLSKPNNDDYYSHKNKIYSKNSTQRDGSNFLLKFYCP